MATATAPRPTFWVMRVLLHEGRRVQLDMMSPGALVATMALVDTGDLAMLPDGCIAEPVEGYDLEALAHEHRAKLLHDDPDGDYRVMMAVPV